MKNLHEIINSLKNDENAEQIAEATEAADALHGGNKQLYSRAKKAEGFEQDENGKWVKKEELIKPPEPIKPEAPPSKKEETSNEPDLKDKYEKLALKTDGITHEDDQKVVLDEAKRLDLDVEEVMSMEHIKAKLKANKDKRDAGDAMPDGKGKSGGDFKGEVEYWVDKKNDDGSYQTPEDPELAGKVIAARVKQQKNQAQFEPIRV